MGWPAFADEGCGLAIVGAIAGVADLDEGSMIVLGPPQLKPIRDLIFEVLFRN